MAEEARLRGNSFFFISRQQQLARVRKVHPLQTKQVA
jgi:hypothetical protein